MGISVGELFVELGIKGSDKTVGALTETNKSMQGLAETSLEAKAAIVGAFYWLEQLFAKSGALGTSLKNFSLVTGESSEVLQRYQYAMRQVGVTNEDTADTFKKLQDIVANTKLGHGVPKGLFAIAQTVGISEKEFDEALKSPEKLLLKLQEFAVKSKQLGIAEGIRNQFLKSFNISDNVIAALASGSITQKALNNAPIYSDAQVNQLNKANIAWQNLGVTLDMIVGKFNALHGNEIVNDIAKVTYGIGRLVDALTKLGDAFKIFSVFNAWAKEQALFITSLANILNPKSKYGEGGKDLSNLFHSLVRLANPGSLLAEAIVGKGNKNVTVNQTNNFHHNAMDHQKTGETVKTATDNALRQSNANSVSH